MSDPLLTVRKETHENLDGTPGWSLWVLVKKRWYSWYSKEHKIRPVWICVDSTVVGNINETLEVDGPIEKHPIVKWGT